MYLFQINYNRTNRILVAKHTVNTKGVRDKRLAFVKRSWDEGVEHVQITLRNLTMQDNGLYFSYKFQDNDLDETSGMNVVRVSSASRGGLTEDTSQAVISVTHLVIICVVVAVVVASVVLVVLCRRGVNTDTPPCAARHNRQKSGYDERRLTGGGRGDPPTTFGGEFDREYGGGFGRGGGKRGSGGSDPRYTEDLQRHLYFSSPSPCQNNNNLSNKPIELLQMEYAHVGPGGVMVYKPKVPTPTKTFNSPPPPQPKVDNVERGYGGEGEDSWEYRCNEPIMCRIEYR